ncbi:MAG: type II toxin-antitoxin system Phd/YefM family antitoxin [Microbacteriaceae bacterium]
MKTITVAQLRQNPTAALDAVERGETYVVTRHRREIGRLVPPLGARPVTAEQFAAVLGATPLDGRWAGEVAAARSAVDAEPDPWSAT